MTTILVLVATICIGWSMWTRWTSWSCRWELASTIAVTLLGAGVILTATPAWHYAIGLLAQEMWGWPEIELDGAGVMIGHVCLMFAAGAIAIAAGTRLVGVTRSTIMAWIIAPLGGTLGIMIMSTTVDIATSYENWRAWLSLYLLAFYSGLAYLLGCATLALFHLAHDARQRPMAVLYAIPCGAGTMAYAGQVAATWFGGSALSVVTTVCMAVWIIGFALAAAISWNRKMSGFKSLQRKLKSPEDWYPLEDAA